MKYYVFAEDENGQVIRDIQDVNGAKLAANEAKAMASEHTGESVYVSWTRQSDGTHGYLNPDGNHDFTGHRW